MERDRCWRRYRQELQERRRYKSVHSHWYWGFTDTNGIKQQHPKWYNHIGDRTYLNSSNSCSGYKPRYSPNSPAKYRDVKKQAGGQSTGSREKDKEMYRRIIIDELYEMGR
jgi:hypothetical protein